MTTSSAHLDALRDELLALPDDALEPYLRKLDTEQLTIVKLALARPVLLPHQRPPDIPWTTWLMLAGRGAGKTQAASVWFDQHMTGEPCDDRLPGGHLGLIVAPTQSDAVNSCFKGPSGLQILNPSTRMTTSREGTTITWPGGATALCLGAHSPDDVERFRSAGNRCALWAEELAAWRKLQDAWDIMAFGLRTVGGTAPRTVASTTPKAKPVIRALLADPRTAVTRARTSDNPHLNEERRAELYAKYGGTRLGRQELEGELIEDIEGALWKVDLLDLHRLWEMPTPAKRVVIGVDPTGGRAECGIVAAALGADKRVYVIGDYSVERPTPAVWGARVVSAYHLAAADRIAVERNYGGDMVRHTVRTSPGGDALPIKDVIASRGKQVRAEPISNLFEQGRAVLVGSFPELEAQLTTWVPLDNEPSPDRLDAMVWAITELVPGLLAVPGRGTGRQIAEARIGVR